MSPIFSSSSAFLACSPTLPQMKFDANLTSIGDVSARRVNTFTKNKDRAHFSILNSRMSSTATLTDKFVRVLSLFWKMCNPVGRWRTRSQSENCPKVQFQHLSKKTCPFRACICTLLCSVRSVWCQRRVADFLRSVKLSTVQEWYHICGWTESFHYQHLTCNPRYR